MRHDPHSYADPDQALTERVHLDLEVHFDRRCLTGTATLVFQDQVEGPVDLDCRGLRIDAVTDADGTEVPWALGETDPVLGERLRLLPTRPTQTLTVRYETSADASALMWLDPAQTSGEHPFLLSQCQAIHARSIAPLQDSPRHRIRYSARIVVPEALSAVMSAAPGVSESLDDGRRAFSFEMPQPIPPYLLALAVGDLASHDLGPRCRVFSEPAVLEQAAWEFAEVEQMLTAAEELFGPYAWERYDFLVLPSSFPLGGMENPRMTFLTPTLLAGDRSLVAVLAHELAHSWTGNLVTNANNEHFWLNEGFTVWAELRIVEALYGREEAVQQAVLGRRALEETLEEHQAAGAPTALTYPQQGIDPDVAFSRIPYEKGFLLVAALEHDVGRERFDRFIQDYIERFRFQTLTSQEFVDFVGEALPESMVDLPAWLAHPGIPDDAPRFQSDRLDALTAAEPETLANETLTVTETLHVLANLPTKSTVDARALADTLGITQTGNAELRSAWLAYAVQTGTSDLEPALREFVGTVGRTKLLKPIVAAMVGTEHADLAHTLYRENESRLHSSTRGTLEAVLSIGSQG